MLRKMRHWTTGPSSGLLAIILILTLVASFAVPVLAAETPPPFLFKWGSYGTGDGQFSNPHGVATDSSGNVYVADSENDRIQKFTSTGAFLTKWGTHGHTVGGEFFIPWGIDVSPAGNVYVTDMSNNRIQKFTSTGTWLATWAPVGSDNLSSPYGLAVDSSGNVYVADSINCRIQKFDSNGNFLAKWGTTGAADGQILYPYDVAVDASGNVYVADMGNNRIDKFTSTGTFITKWGSGGTGDGQFNSPLGVAVDASGNVYVADNSNNRIQKFTSTGVFLSKWGSGPGSGDGQFNSPYTLVATSGNVYVADTENDRIQVFGYPPITSASVNTATGTGTATFTTSSGSITGLTAATSTPCGTPAVFFPHGFFSFNIINLLSGATVTITITLPANMPANTQYWKCINGQWVDCSSLLGSNDGDNIITLTITDGSQFDADGQANGTIVDPGGPSIVPLSTTIPAKPRASPSLPRQLKPAQMSVLYMSVSPQQAAANQLVTISTNVVNTGDEAGNLNVTLKINSQAEQTRMVSVGPQGTQPVKFTVTKAQPGTYTIDIGGQKGSFIVLGNGSTAHAPVNGGLIVILLMGILILATVVVLVATRRRPA